MSDEVGVELNGADTDAVDVDLASRSGDSPVEKLSEGDANASNGEKKQCKVIVVRAYRAPANSAAPTSKASENSSGEFDVSEQIRVLTQLAARRTSDDLEELDEANLSTAENGVERHSHDQSFISLDSEPLGVRIVTASDDEVKAEASAEQQAELCPTKPKLVDKSPRKTSQSRKRSGKKLKSGEAGEFLDDRDRRALARWHSAARNGESSKADRFLEGPFVQTHAQSPDRLAEVHNPALSVDLSDRATVSSFWKPNRHVASDAQESPFACAFCCGPPNVALTPKKRRVGVAASVSLGALYGPHSVGLTRAVADRLVRTLTSALQSLSAEMLSQKEQKVREKKEKNEKREKKRKEKEDDGTWNESASLLLDATFAQVLGDEPTSSMTPTVANETSTKSMLVENSMLPSVIIRRLTPPNSNGMAQLDGNFDELEADDPPEAPATSDVNANVILNVYVHGDCVLWTPSTFWTGVELIGLDEALSEAWASESRCEVCDRGGASLGCLATRCPHRYHLPCALRVGCELFDQNVSVRCPSHRS